MPGVRGIDAPPGCLRIDAMAGMQITQFPEVAVRRPDAPAAPKALGAAVVLEALGPSSAGPASPLDPVLAQLAQAAGR